eukprot:g927.t1
MAHHVLRAAWDIGSGMTKLQVAEVDLARGSVVSYLMEEEVEVLYGGEFSPFIYHLGLLDFLMVNSKADWKANKDSNALSDSVQLAGLEAVRTLKAKALALGVQESAAVGTEVFRKAANGAEVLEKMRQEGLLVQLIPQDVEALLGFRTAISAGKHDPSTVLAWDSGGASFQLSYQGANPSEKLKCYLGHFGSTVMGSLLVQDLRNESLQFTDATVVVNPVGVDEVKQMVEHVRAHMPALPDWLQEALAAEATAVVGIGGPTSIFSIACALTQLNPVTVDDVWAAIESNCGKQEAELAHLPQPKLVLPKMALLYAVMRKLGIAKFHFQSAMGCGPGLLVSPEFWGGGAGAGM